MLAAMRNMRMPFGYFHIAVHECKFLFNVGPPRIELGLNAPHALVLPVYYGP